MHACWRLQLLLCSLLLFDHPIVSSQSQFNADGCIAPPLPASASTQPHLLSHNKSLGQPLKSRTRLGRKCAHPEGCDEASTRVVYGFLDNDTRFCKMHRCPDHRDLSNKKNICSFKGCLKYATFGQERSSLEQSMTDQNMFCKDHKPDGAGARFRNGC